VLSAGVVSEPKGERGQSRLTGLASKPLAGVSLRRGREENRTPVTTAGLAGPVLIVRRLKTVGGSESLSYFWFGLPICRRVGIRLQPTISCGVPPRTSDTFSWFASWRCLALGGAIPSVVPSSLLASTTYRPVGMYYDMQSVPVKPQQNLPNLSRWRRRRREHKTGLSATASTDDNH
jgi:hypothetical protein